MFYFAVTIEFILVFYYIFCKRKNAIMARTWKALASVGFVVLGIVAFMKQLSTYGIFILIGLLLGSLGDYFLACQYCNERKKDMYFILGLGAFMLGHIAYFYAFNVLIGSRIIQLSLLCFGLAYITILLLEKLQFNFQKMKLPVFVYCGVIYLMEFQALQFFAQPSPYVYILNIGTVLFVLSDLILACIYFRKMNREPMNRWNLSCYYLAQILIAIHLYVSFA